MTTAKELLAKTPDQLRDSLVQLKKEAFNLRFQAATNQLTNTARMKAVRKSKKYRAHDEHNKFKTGDTVRIEECAPISKTKRWTVVAEA